jgi:hypothetical protein
MTTGGEVTAGGGTTAGGASKRAVTLAVAVPAIVLLADTTRAWATGRSGDVLSTSVVDVTGSAAAPGAIALTVVVVAGVLALMTGGRVIRSVASVVMVLAAVGAGAIVLAVALRPRDTVSAALATALGRTTAPDATGATTPWVWVGVVAGAALVAGALLAAVSSRRWSGLSARYEIASDPGRNPGAEGPAAESSDARGPRGQVRTSWDDLTDGHDPTLRDGPGQT